MALFDDHIIRLRTFLFEKENSRELVVFDGHRAPEWPSGGRNNLVLSADTAVELGSPQTASSAFLLWTDRIDTVNHGRISLIGPDTCQETRALAPFGKVVDTHGSASGCLPLAMNVLWWVFGGLEVAVTHLVFALLCAITVIGMPFAAQHMKLLRLALVPFGATIR